MDRASEDFVAIDGKLFKLDQTSVSFDNSDYLQPKTLKTRPNHFPERHCDLVYTPAYMSNEGVNAVFFTFLAS